MSSNLFSTEHSSKISKEAVSSRSPLIPRAIASIDFDPNGDVVLVLSDHIGQARFRVNSYILAFVSPVFKALLGPASPFLEATRLTERARQPNSPPLEVTLRDDNPKALAIILWATHHRPDKVPLSMNGDRLYEVALVCDKYNIPRSPLELLLQRWIPNTRFSYDSIFKWLFISYVFEETRLFKDITAELVKDYTISAVRGEMKRNSDSTLKSSICTPAPDRIKVAINHAIQKALQDLIACADTLLQKYELSTSYQCRHPDADDEVKYACDSVNFGFIERGLKKLSLHPKERDLSSFSAGELRFKLLKLEIPFFYKQTFESCCSNPKLESYFTHSGKNVCTCGKEYTTTRVLDHSTTCSPIPRFRDEVRQILYNLDGLNLQDILPGCRTSTQEKLTMAKNDLWECLQYKTAG